jgi:hypothetical protein
MSRKLSAIGAVLAIFILAGAAESRASDVIVIVHPTNTVPSLSLEDVRRLYQVAEKFWPDRRRVVLLLPPLDSASMDALVRKVLVVSDSGAVAGYYLKAIFRGRLSALPTRSLGTADTVAKVARERGAIGLADRADLTPHAAVRQIEVPGL